MRVGCELHRAAVIPAGQRGDRCWSANSNGRPLIPLWYLNLLNRLANPMQLILDKDAGDQKRKKSPLQACFDKLSAQLARKRRQQQRFKKDIDELAETSRRLNAEHDRSQLSTLIALADKLTTFSGRKSLSNWHRDELLDWLRELILMRIAPLEPQTAERLRVQYEETIAALAGMTREQAIERVHAQLEEAERQAQQFYEEELADAEELEDFFQDDLFGFDDGPAEPDEADPETADDNPIAGSRETEEFSITDSAWLKGLFRQAAQALHPDREADPEHQRRKLQQMKELLRARKQNDVMSMLAIYGEAIGENDIRIAEAEMHHICKLIEQQIDALEFEQMEYVESHPERAFAHAVLYHSSSKKRARLLQQWRAQLELEAEGNRRLVTDLRNLTVLKEALRDRHDRRLDMFSDLLEDVDIDSW